MQKEMFLFYLSEKTSYIFRLLQKKIEKKSEMHIKIPKQPVSLFFDGSMYSIIQPF